MLMPPLELNRQRRADLRACRALLGTGSRSFALASLLLPPRVRVAATAFYAFCRLADDAIDAADDADAALTLLRARLQRLYLGRPQDHPVERLFTDVIHHFGIPRALLEALLEGFEWDTAGRRYHTAEQLSAYAARVAGSVGAVMTLLMGVRSQAALARACDLGAAMQLTNIARDVGEDARNGRIYLPIAWLQQAGIDVDGWLARPQFSAALGGVVERLLCAADELYERAAAGIALLPPDCRLGIHAARLLYAQIGHEVRRRGCDSVSSRAHVGTGRKLRVIGRAVRAAARSAAAVDVEPLEEARFLVAAVDNGLPIHTGTRHARCSDAEWLLKLFERLQRQDQLLALEQAVRR